MRPRLTTPDWTILAGAALMIFSAAGWVLNVPRPEAELPAMNAVALLPTLPGPQNVPAEPTGAANDSHIDDSSAAFLVPVQPQTVETTPTPAQAGPVPTATVTPATPLPPGAPLPAPTSLSIEEQGVPDRIVIPNIQLDAPVYPSTYTLVQVDGQEFQQWQAPNSYAAGWQTSSVGLGVPGNTVLLGHNNINGEVFARLVDLAEGDQIQVYSGGQAVTYRVDQKMILPEKGQDLSVRLTNASWLLPTEDERLTLVTCWPQTSNTHRLIIVARPVQ
jgi:LPXTG-site transpeptidase (sortase) family protein